MKNRRFSLWWVLALGGGAFVSGCDRASAPNHEEARAALTVELVSPAVADWPEVLEAVGSIAPWQESIVGAEVGDLRLEEVLVNVGDVVEKGELLARFNAELPTADLALAEALVAEREAGAALARDRFERARRLEGSGTLSEETLLQYAADAKAGAAQLASAQAQLQLQRLRLRHTEVRAPDDGIISARTATVGSVVGAGAELFRLIRQGRLEWRATVPADELARVRAGQTVLLKRPGKAAARGVVRQVSPVVDAATLNGTVYVDLPQTGSLRAGMFVTGELHFSAAPALHVPESALVFRDGFQYVMTVDASNRVRQVKVSTGRRLGRFVEIVGPGLALEDRVVRSGGSFLNADDLVRIAQANTDDAGARTEPLSGGGARR